MGAFFIPMRITSLLLLFFVWACSKNQDTPAPLFTNYTSLSGVNFSNDLTYTDQLNPYTYRNFYNGAGVGIGDINNDGLSDLYFTGNQVDNKLYLNEGNFKFRDITDQAGVACAGVWSTGVTLVDINSDGFLDIYVCKSGNPEGANRHNELFINNGDLTFTERSKEYGLDVIGLSVQAAFFDYDKDGDLDCYLLTNSFKSIGHYDLVENQRSIPDAQGGGNKFFINENGKFRDYSAEAKIYRSSIGFGLGITLGDFNEDTWTDIFISNDFFERDYLYINDQQGGFTESLTEYFKSISMGSMGADFADLDNDGQSELFVTEMLPDSLTRKKTKTVYENWDKHQLNVANGYYEQFSRNVLQKKTGRNSYAEVGRLAGIAASEWSWGALLFDMNNDGQRDIFIANGIYKDLLDRDYLAYSGSEENVRKIIKEEQNAILKLIDLMPASKFPNYAFRNEGDLKFKNCAEEWGLGEPMFSSGSAYGDLDNDGDLDLVVNNINAPAGVFRNNSDSSRYKSISFTISSKGKDTFSVGTLITAYCGQKIFTADNFVTRGFQSSVEPVITIGLGEEIKVVDSVHIRWPEGARAVMYKVPVNKRLTVSKEDIQELNQRGEEHSVGEFSLERIPLKVFKHQRSGLIDFNRDRLLPHAYGNELPALLKGDVNRDGVEEIYLGGGKDQAGIFIDFKNGLKTFQSSEIGKYKISEETKGLLLDVDNDGDLDLYLASGGRFYSRISNALQDRLFINDGNGDFKEASNALPFNEYFSTSVVVAIDFDNDGDSDLLVCERFDPFYYGLGGRGFLLQNNGKGIFTDVTQKVAPELMKLGMITDAEIVDFDKDGWNDIVLVGDWMPITLMKNKQGSFVKKNEDLGVANTEGWWNDIAAADLNRDGKPDFIVGNHGLNTFFKAGDRMYVNDFDKNGSVEQIFCTDVNGKYYPIADKDEIVSQLPALKKQLLYYKDYAKKSIDQIFPQPLLSESKIFQVNLLASVILMSGPAGYHLVDLPLEAQYAPIYSLLIDDFDKDGIDDLMAGGNQLEVKPQFGSYDASEGWYFKGRLTGSTFTFEKGINLKIGGQIRDIEVVEANGIKYVLFAKYDDEFEIYKVLN